MNILIEDYKIECFDTEKEYKLYLKDQNKHFFENCIYHGDLYTIPQETRDLFKDNIIVSIKKKNYNNVQYILITK